MAQSQHYNNDNVYNDNNVMRVSVWFHFFDGLLQWQNPWYMGGKRDNEEWHLNWEHPFPKVSRYKRRSDIKEVDITEFGVHHKLDINLD